MNQFTTTAIGYICATISFIAILVFVYNCFQMMNETDKDT